MRGPPTVFARALHNLGLIRVEGRGPAWTAKITAEGTHLLKEHARRVEAEAERAAICANGFSRARRGRCSGS
jgi:hypothetical protein